MADVSSSISQQIASSSANNKSYSFTGADPYLAGQANYYNSVNYGRDAMNYQNILGGYRDMLATIYGTPASADGKTAAQPGALQALQGGYGSLNNNVQGMLTGIGGARKAEIADEANRQTGSAQQQLINSGLYDSTLGLDMSRAIASDKSRSENQLSESLAQLGAGYQSQIGLQGLGAYGGMIGQTLGVGSDYLRTLGGYNPPTPTWSPLVSASEAVGNSSSTSSGYTFTHSNPVLPSLGPPSKQGAGFDGYDIVGTNPFGPSYYGQGGGNPLTPPVGGQIPLSPGKGIGPLNWNSWG